MTDRELLELAAKAYGAAQYPETGEWEYFFERDPDDDGEFKEWNPLADDGDALRLAVQLHLSVCVEFDQTWIASHGYPTTPVCFENHGTDPDAASRRAIVRAAAEIGKAMK